MRKDLTPVNPEVAKRVLMSATYDDGCLISHLTPSKDRPWVWLQALGKSVAAARVVAADSVGRPIETTEEVHHECEVRRCVRPDHLAIELETDHRAHHAEKTRQEACSVHGTPYPKRDARGWGQCPACIRAASAAYRERKRAS